VTCSLKRSPLDLLLLPSTPLDLLQLDALLHHLEVLDLVRSFEVRADLVVI
jgi:hypothetical protein